MVLVQSQVLTSVPSFVVLFPHHCTMFLACLSTSSNSWKSKIYCYISTIQYKSNCKIIWAKSLLSLNFCWLYQRFGHGKLGLFSHKLIILAFYWWRLYIFAFLYKSDKIFSCITLFPFPLTKMTRKEKTEDIFLVFYFYIVSFRFLWKIYFCVQYSSNSNLEKFKNVFSFQIYF